MFKINKHLIKKKMKEKKGSAFIEYTVGLLMLVVFVGFSLDLITIANKHFFISSEMSKVARTLSVQSGVQQYTPNGFPGGDESYKSSSELLEEIREEASTVGFKDDEWEVHYKEINHSGNVVKEGVLTNETEFNVDYLNKISVTFIGKYDWNLIDSMVPVGEKDHKMTISRMSMAEFVRDYSN